ncbi:MAG: hypothetical protein IH593_07375, partial [Bacteroidales bacterium]|nr:hypothetical protein [Bacteroidales bacterium]
MKKIFVVTVLFLIHCIAFAQPFVPGASYFGRANYIEYIAGNLPLVITVPHGGSLTPGEIPDRSCGDESSTDLYTVNLVKSIQQKITELTGCYPHIIINHLKRTKLDANRDLDIATCGNEFAEIAWNEFHLFIDSAKLSVERKSSKGLLIDLHGHGHANQRLELGYLLKGDQLSYPEAVLNTSASISLSSIRNLVGTNVNGFTHSELLHGIFSLGTMFASVGYPAVPGIDEPFPYPEEPYFRGGYNTERHGSLNEGTIDAIQIECNQDVRFEETARNSFGETAAKIFLDYLIKHYFPDLPDIYCQPVDIQLSESGSFSLYPVPFMETLSVRSLIPVEVKVFSYR